MQRHALCVFATSFACLISVGLSSACAQCPVLPNQLTNGQTADATQVMANFDQIESCLNTGQLVVPPVPDLAVTSPGGGTATIQNPSATSNYNFNLPAGPGTTGQFLASGGPSGAMTWVSAPSLSTPPMVDGIPIGRPAASAFTWVNQGGASETEYANGPITLTIPAQSGDQIRGFGQPPPGSVPYTLTVKFDTLLWGTLYYTCGIYIIDSTGKVLGMSYHTQTSTSSTTPHFISANRFNSTTSFNSSPRTAFVSESRTWWFRVTNDGTNWTFYVSHNGADWIQFYSEAVTSFLGPTISSLGVYGDINDTASTGLSALVSIWSFELANGSGTNSSWQ